MDSRLPPQKGMCGFVWGKSKVPTATGTKWTNAMEIDYVNAVGEERTMVFTDVQVHSAADGKRWSITCSPGCAPASGGGNIGAQPYPRRAVVLARDRFSPCLHFRLVDTACGWRNQHE